jgi:hypothetical protein
VPAHADAVDRSIASQTRLAEAGIRKDDARKSVA